MKKLPSHTRRRLVPVALLAFAAVAACLAVLVGLLTPSRAASLGTAATWAAISAGLVGTTVALAALNHARAQLAATSQTAATAEVDRRIERHIAHRRNAIDLTTGYLNAAQGLVAHLLTVRALTLADSDVYKSHGHVELHLAREVDGRLQSVPVSVGMAPALDYFRHGILPARIRATGAVEGTRLIEIVEEMSDVVDRCIQQVSDLQGRADRGDIVEFRRRELFTAPEDLAAHCGEWPSRIQTMISRHVSLNPDRVAEDIRGSHP